MSRETISQYAIDRLDRALSAAEGLQRQRDEALRLLQGAVRRSNRLWWMAVVGWAIVLTAGATAGVIWWVG